MTHIRRWKQRAAGWIPMFRTTHRSALDSMREQTASEQRDESQRFESRLIARDAEVAKHVARLVNLDWSHGERDCYAVKIEFHAGMFGYAPTKGDMFYLAEQVGRMVASEIATSRFIQKARREATHAVDLERAGGCGISGGVAGP